MQEQNKYYNEDGTMKGFMKAFKCIPACYAAQFEDDLRKSLSWSKSTFEAKKRGVRKLNDTEKPIVKEILNKYGVDFNTGENIYYR